MQVAAAGEESGGEDTSYDTQALLATLATSDEDTTMATPDLEASMTSAPLSEKELRKQKKKEMKAMKRAKRDGKILNLKKCDLCGRENDLLIRCMTDATQIWRMVCGKCWKEVRGGVVDGDAEHVHYRYGGLWKAY